MYVTERRIDYMKFNVSIIGSCQSRDIFNSKFINNYKDYFRVYSYYTMTSMLSVMSPDIKYNFNNLEKSTMKHHNIDHWYYELEKPILKTLATKKPDILLLDFYCEARYGAIEYDGGYIVNRYSKIANMDIIDRSKFGKAYTYLDNTTEFIELWKRAFDHFMRFMRENLPETKIVVNTIKGTNVYLDDNGEEKISPRAADVDVDKVNSLWCFFDNYAIFKYGLDAIRFDKEYLLDPNYIFGGLGVALVHFQHEYYEDCFNKLVDVVSGFDKCYNLTSEINLVDNNFFGLKNKRCHSKGKLKIINGGEKSFLEFGIDKEVANELRPQVWTLPIEIIDDGETKYELSFDLIINNEEVLKEKKCVIFTVRTFKYLKQYKYLDSLTSESLYLDSCDITVGQPYRYIYTFTSKGKYVRLAPFMKKYVEGIEYSNIELKCVGK